MMSWKDKAVRGQSQVQVMKLLPEDETTHIDNANIIVTNYESIVFLSQGQWSYSRTKLYKT